AAASPSGAQMEGPGDWDAPSLEAPASPDAAPRADTADPPPGTAQAPEARRLSAAEELELAYENLRSDEPAVWRAAERRITRAWLKSGSDSMDLLMERGRMAVERENWEAAIDHLTDLVNLAPDYAEGWNARANVFFKQDKIGAALADLAETIARDPRHFNAFASLGVIFERLDDAPRALAAYRAALEIHPNQETAQKGVARLAATAEGRPT
ncbi:MAG: tetratricopeptide repeat protein, partial [Pseudomonadota bacterium]